MVIVSVHQWIRSQTEIFIFLYIAPSMPDETKQRKPVLETTNMRSLWTPPSLYHDWDQDYEERASGWWELFVDLLLVAACTNIADGFKENATAVGLGRFLLQIFTFQTAWYGYVAHTSRFKDTSLAHSALLLLYLGGTSSMVIYSSGFGAVELRGYTVGMLVQRGALAIMYLNVAFHIARARYFAACIVFQLGIQITFLLVASAMHLESEGTDDKTGSHGDGSGTVLWLWAATVIAERMSFPVLSCFLGRSLVPINIDHFADREGAFVMVVLGESVISEAISYRQLSDSSKSGYEYIIGALIGFVMTFSLALMYFHVQPERKQHAYRISRARGLSMIQTHMLLTAALLALGTGTKLAMAAVSGNSEGGGGDDAEHHSASQMSYTQVWVLHGSLACVLVLLMVVRLLHYGGIEPKSTDCDGVWRLKMWWWGVLGVWWVLPLVAGGCLVAADSGGDGVPPLQSLRICSGLTVAVMLIETSLTHCLQEVAKEDMGRRAAGLVGQSHDGGVAGQGSEEVLQA